jgi:ankyrin repeat protein
VYAERALTTTELCHALAVEPDDKARLDADNVLDVEDVVSVCAGLVTIDKHSNVIRLVHYTAQEYFESIRETWNPGGQLDLARTCLTYLSFDTFRNGRCSSDDMFEDRLAQHPFFDYASQNWGKHALTVQESLFDLASSVLRDDAVVSSIVQATSVYRVGSHQYSQGYPRITTGLHLMSELGLHVLADEILTKFERTTGQWITQKDNDGRTCLYIAASYGRKSMVKLLLGKGADVNADCGRHARALFAAVQSRHKRIVELLIDSGADVKADGPKLMGNVLQTALQNNDREMTMLLLHKGAEADITDQFQRTPLELASRRGWCDVVELIIDQVSAVYPMACNDYGMMPLHEACFHGHAEVVKMLLNRGVDASITGKDGWISIHAAAFNGHAEVIQTLLEAGGDPNTMDKRRWTPLMYASYGGHHEAIRVLLRNRAHSHICDTSARSPVHIAAYNGHLQAVNLLTDRVIEIDERDRKGYTPLYDAATQGHADVVRLLLERGADPNIPDDTRWVPIIAASANGHLEVVRALVHHGADLSLTGIDGWGPLTIAADYGHNDIVDLLLPAYSNPQGAPVPSVSSLFSLVEKGRLNALRLFHEQLNIDLHSIDPHGRNLLHAAARHRQLKTFSFLKDIGVEILAIDHKGDDLLCQAASSGSLLLLNTVLDIMPNRSTPNNRSWGPLHWACRTGGKDIIERLIQVGVQSHNVTTLQHEGSWSPTDIAVYHGNSDMLQSLSDSCRTALGPNTRARNVGKHFTNFICDGCEHVSRCALMIVRRG